MNKDKITAGEHIRQGDEIYIQSSINGPSYAYKKQNICLHLKAYLREEDEVPFAWCPECGNKMHLEIVITNLMDQLRGHLNKFSALGGPP